MRNMVSMKDIAERCKVSVASVSKALNGYRDIGEDTRGQILAAAKELGYMPNASARTLKTKRSYNLGVLFADAGMSGLTHEYFNHVLESFKQTAQEKGYDITFTSCNAAGQKMSYYEHCRYREVDGVLVACINYEKDNIRDLIDSDIPLVTIDHAFEGRIAVVSNNGKGMSDLVHYIAEKGHKKIAYICGDDTPITRNRLTGFYRAMEQLRLAVPDEYVIRSLYRNTDMAAAATARLLDLVSPPTCILYPDDMAALGGMNEIRSRGLRIPADVSVAGYDGSDMIRILNPKLATICQDSKMIGKMAAEKLISLIEHPKTTLIDKFLVDGVLFKGDTVTAPKKI